MEKDNYFDHHLFCCTNRRPDGHKRGSCAAKGSEKLRDYMKARAKEMNVPSARVNAAGCLDRCELGPVIVIYPEGIWYRCRDEADAELILNEHLLNGRIVESLLLKNDDQ